MPRTPFYPTHPQPERCILVGVASLSEKRWQVEIYLDELAALADTAGAVVIDRIIQERSRIDPAFYIGKGKAVSIAERIKDRSIDLIIFDHELSSTQLKNLEQLIEIKVIDRTALILDIFAAHARTREAKLQVEMAQLSYYLSRLTRQWSHLSRQVGGIGTKGPGETQLETDRRLIRTRLAYLKKELEKIDKQDHTQRKEAQRLINVAIIGYTNAGKSTLMNALTRAGTNVEDKLFATLDTTVRRLILANGKTVLLSDTVGFIRKLPPTLIASFKTTLAHTVDADILLHVVDSSDPNFSEHISVVKDILTELHSAEKPTILIMNKIDKITDSSLVQKIKNYYPQALLISAKNSIRIERIKQNIFDIVQTWNRGGNFTGRE
jgi:GTP-binding protein HflX